MSKKVALIILDGWGIGKADESDGVFMAQTPCFDQFLKDHPSGKLITYGDKVGLPSGQMGNSEVGHLNIGAGRIVYQDLLRINNAIEDKSFYSEQKILDAISYAKKNKVKIHIMGLTSKGGVHSSLDHLIALCDIMHKNDAPKVYIHAFTDGRDCDPRSALPVVLELQEKLKNTSIKIATLIGRYYAMDRDQRWERIKKAYDLLVHGLGSTFNNPEEAINASYNAGITDEFLEPIVINEVDGKIHENDVVLCFNFRTDRCRQITKALMQKNFPEYKMSKIPLHYLTMTNYDKQIKGIHVIYDKENLKNTIGEVVSDNNKTQLRIAETEKYPHVTYFFGGGREEPFSGEKRVMIESPKVPTYDQKPEMSAIEVTDAVCANIDDNTPDFICLNFANPDMVGHTGVPKAIIKACETVDKCLNRVVAKALEKNYSLVIIADHGNADKMFNLDGSPHTAHTVNLVPMIVMGQNISHVNDGVLADVAPTILSLMKLEQPKQMTGSVLI